ncbi:carbonic anhydrase 6-like isoform X2 [Apis dorsata]|uniref:carbonic anhydrase 6-like isoform X2 n=1 Tax=Apis dorsata TaxID=7462 RepID=UPI0003DF7B63|nr:carbonic anhydrase 6-like isoform X2 [Apis dorsata]
MENFYIIFTTIIVLCTARASDWSYSGEHGPTYWPGLCVTGKKQSPINIVTEDTINTDIGELKFIRYDFAFECKITNNGHSVQLQLSGVPVHLEGANLESTYILEQIHFHWPAEHTVDNNRDALELHFVHYKEQYGNTSAASKHENGIAVVATLFELDSEDNMEIMPILKATELISNGIGKSTELNESKFIPSLFLPKDHTTYYHYDGSFTTPGCQETVMWYILTEKLSVSEQQLNVFKSVETRNGTLSFNYRPTQAIGERTIYHHLLGYSTAGIVSCNLLNVYLSLFLSKFLLYN